MGFTTGNLLVDMILLVGMLIAMIVAFIISCVESYRDKKKLKLKG